MTRFGNPKFTVGSTGGKAAQNYRDNYDRIFGKSPVILILPDGTEVTADELRRDKHFGGPYDENGLEIATVSGADPRAVAGGRIDPDRAATIGTDLDGIGDVVVGGRGDDDVAASSTPATASAASVVVTAPSASVVTSPAVVGAAEIHDEHEK